MQKIYEQKKSFPREYKDYRNLLSTEIITINISKPI